MSSVILLIRLDIVMASVIGELHIEQEDSEYVCISLLHSIDEYQSEPKNIVPKIPVEEKIGQRLKMPMNSVRSVCTLILVAAL